MIKHAKKIHETCSDVDYRRVDSKNYTARHLELSNMYKPGRTHIKDWISNRDQTDMTYFLLANIPVYGKNISLTLKGVSVINAMGSVLFFFFVAIWILRKFVKKRKLEKQIKELAEADGEDPDQVEDYPEIRELRLEWENPPGHWKSEKCRVRTQLAVVFALVLFLGIFFEIF